MQPARISGAQSLSRADGWHIRAPLRDLATTLALWLAAFLIYLPSANYGFVYYDDVRILAHHPELYNWTHLAQAAKAIAFTEFPREEPLLLRDFSWAIDSRIFGFGNPHGFHFVNVLLHACVIALCFLCLRRITRRYAVALLATVCYLSLAVHVEPVAWLMGRKDLLVALFGFLALMAHSCALDATARARRWAWYGASLVAVILALLSKISAVTYPGVLALLALFQPDLRAERPPGTPFPWGRIPGALAGVWPHLVAGVWICHWYRGVLTTFGLLNRSYTATPWQHLRNLLILNPLALLSDLRALAAAGPLTLFHPWPGHIAAYRPIHYIAATVILAALAGIAWLLLARRRDLAFYFLAFFVLMVPYLNIQYVGIWVANRYLYFSAFCLMAGAATLAVDAARRGPRALAIASLALVASFCARNGWSQARYLAVWRDAETLWSYEMHLASAPPDPYNNLASYYYTAATETTDTRLREALLRKTERVVAEARARFQGDAPTPPRALHSLLFLDALIAIIHNEPPAQQLAALETVERLAPDDDSVLWQLMTFHYKQALRESNAAQREAGARRALAYYQRYRRCTYREAGTAAKDRAVREEFCSDFPFLTSAVEALP